MAALTFDKDYQKKRQEIMNQQPQNIPAGLAQGGRGLVLVILFVCLYVLVKLSCCLSV